MFVTSVLHDKLTLLSFFYHFSQTTSTITGMRQRFS